MKNVWDAAQRNLEGVFVLSKRRIKFSKTGMGKYISHLDLLRTFSRSILRSGLPVRYSQGFNPHQLITFSLPLPIGVTSICEYVDIDFEDTVSDDEIMEKLNQNLPMDIQVRGIGSLRYKASTICAADYRIELRTSQTVEKVYLDDFFSSKEVTVEKKTKKKGIVQINLMAYIENYSYIQEKENGCVFDVRLCAGGEKNLKPEILVEALLVFLREKSIQTDSADIERREIYCGSAYEEVPFC